MNFDDIIILTESIKINNGKEAENLIKTKKIGAKIIPGYSDKNNLASLFQSFIDKCESLKIKDYVYGIQFLVSHVSPNDLPDAIKNDAIYEFLNSYKKPWVKQMPEYTKMMNNNYNSSIWHNFEKAIQKEQQNHGKSTKGKGDNSEVKNIYDDGTWSLQSPMSFEGEKSISYYGTNKKQPCNWCTRANKEYYNYYTKTSPLYVIKNKKTGKSYQLAFRYNEVDFLDQNDEKGDDISKGDLTDIPNNLLKLIVHPKNKKTMLDYKNAYEKANKNLSYNKKFFDLKKDELINARKYGPEVKVNDKVVKKEILNYYNNYDHDDNELKKYFEKGKTSGKYIKREKATKYYLKNNPSSYAIVSYGDYKPKIFYNIREYDDREILQNAVEKDTNYEKSNKRTEDSIKEIKNIERGLSNKGENINNLVIKELNKDLEKHSIVIKKIYNAISSNPAFRFENGGIREAIIMPRKFEVTKNSESYIISFLDKDQDESSTLNADKIGIFGVASGWKDFGKETNEFKFWKSVALKAKKIFIKYFRNEIQQARESNMAKIYLKKDPLKEDISCFNY